MAFLHGATKLRRVCACACVHACVRASHIQNSSSGDVGIWKSSVSFLGMFGGKKERREGKMVMGNTLYVLTCYVRWSNLSKLFVVDYHFCE